MNYVIKGFIEVYRKIDNDVEPMIINTSRIISIRDSWISVDVCDHHGTLDIHCTESYGELIRKLFKAQ